MKLPAYTKRSLLALVLLLALAVFLAGHRGLPPTEGILNFGKVNESLFRGAQPDASAVEHLKALGVKSIINLRMSEEASKTDEYRAALAVGIIYTNVPLAGTHRPSDEQVSTILALIQNLPAPVYVHCAHGCDRTGTIIACYRISHDHWSGDAALEEAQKYGLSWFERGMRSYIADFSKTAGLKTNQPAMGKL